MIAFVSADLNFNLILGLFVGFAVVTMLKDTVVELMTFVKGVKIS